MPQFNKGRAIRKVQKRGILGTVDRMDEAQMSKFTEKNDYSVS